MPAALTGSPLTMSLPTAAPGAHRGGLAGHAHADAVVLALAERLGGDRVGREERVAIHKVGTRRAAVLGVARLEQRGTAHLQAPKGGVGGAGLIRAGGSPGAAGAGQVPGGALPRDLSEGAVGKFM